MSLSALCPICGMEDEDSFHVFMRCPHARQLWLAMAESWPMPKEELLKNTGTEWLLHLLHSIPDEQRMTTLMTCWRIWHAHNEITHGKPCPPIEGSRRFLVSYRNSLLMIKKYPDADLVKGKMPAGWDEDPQYKKTRKEPKNIPRWTPPIPREAKLNVDGAFANDGASIGMILRDHLGEVIFTACRHLPHCKDAADAEMRAIEEGSKLALQWTSLRFSVESDCAGAIELINGSTMNSSVHAFRVSDIRNMFRERETKLVKISRDINGPAHELAKLSRLSGRTEFWLASFPQEVETTIALDVKV
jgi:hypothetical protein